MLQETSGEDNTSGVSARKDGILKGTTEMRDAAMIEGDKAERKRVIRLLNDALATEVICILRYKRHYFMTAGLSARHVKATFLQHVAEERAHAEQLVERIVQLGGKPDLSPERLLIRSHAEHIEGESLAEMITANLLDERIAIESYRNMIVTIGPEDPTTQQVLAGFWRRKKPRRRVSPVS